MQCTDVVVHSSCLQYTLGADQRHALTVNCVFELVTVGGGGGRTRPKLLSPHKEARCTTGVDSPAV